MADILSSMTLLEIIELRPNAVEVFRQYEQAAGSCLLCNNLFDSLESVAIRYDIELDKLLEELENIKE
jgi:hypothetical protein